MLSERIAPLAVGSGMLCIILVLISGLFVTDFPATGHIKAMAGYRVLAGAYLTMEAALALFFCACFVIIVLNLA